MRVLFSAVPQTGHVHPLLPLAQALTGSGHEVAFATSPELGARVDAAGFTVFPVGDELAVWFEALAARVGGEPGAGLPPEAILSWFTPRLFGEIGTARTLPDLLGVVSTWHPDLVIHDTLEFAAPIAARVAQVPNVQHTLGPLPPLEILELAGKATAPLWERQQLTAPPFAGSFEWLCLAISPASLETGLPTEVASRVAPLRPVGYDAGHQGESPEWLSRLPDRPLVYGTLGTFLNTDRAVFRAMLDGLADEDVNVVLTVGATNDPDWVGPTPPNARVERYVPQSLLLERCAAVICHGGSGTILPALARRVPLVVLPQGADNFVNAERCAAAGVGVTLMPGAVSADTVADAVRLVLDSREFGVNATRVSHEIASMPEPRDVIGQLEALTRADRG